MTGYSLAPKGCPPEPSEQPTTSSPPDIESPPTLFNQINVHIFEVTAVLDATLQEFHRDNITGLLSAGLHHKVGGSDDDGGESAEIKREQDGLAEEGSSLRKRQCITRSMTVARQRENPPRGDNNADGPPRESSATPTLMDQTGEASNDEVQWDHPEERDDDEVVHNSEAKVNKDRRGCPVEEITDWTDNVDNGLSWDNSEERDDNGDDDDLNDNRATPHFHPLPTCSQQPCHPKYP